MDLFLRQPNIERSVRGGQGCDGTASGNGVAASCGGAAVPHGGAVPCSDGAAPSVGERARDALAGAGDRTPLVPVGRDEREPYSVAGDAYREERAYDARRQRRRKAWAVIRLLLIAIAVPLAVIAAFLIAYCATYIARGATPEELAAALGDLALRVESVFTEVAAQR